MKWLAGPISAYLKEKECLIDDLPFSYEDFVAFLDAIANKTINDHQAKIVIKEMIQTGKNPSDIISDKSFDQAGLDENALATICQ